MSLEDHLGVYQVGELSFLPCAVNILGLLKIYLIVRIRLSKGVH